MELRQVRRVRASPTALCSALRRWRMCAPEMERTSTAGRSQRPSPDAANYSRRPLEHTVLIRRSVQIACLLLNLWIGARFYLWVRFFETGGESVHVPRPAGVEGWLPIAALMNLKYFVVTGRPPYPVVLSREAQVPATSRSRRMPGIRVSSAGIRSCTRTTAIPTGMLGSSQKKFGICAACLGIAPWCGEARWVCRTCLSLRAFVPEVRSACPQDPAPPDVRGIRHYVRYVTSRGGYDEFVCVNCGHPFFLLQQLLQQRSRCDNHHANGGAYAERRCSSK
jgi:hypothetical protein